MTRAKTPRDGRGSKHREILAPADDRSFIERHWLLLLMAVAALGAGLRLYGLANRSLWYDEAVSIYGSRFVNSHLDFLNPQMCRELPLNALLTGMWYPVVASMPGMHMGSAASDFMLRLLPCATSALIVPMTFLIARWFLRDTLAALLAALIIAVSPFQIAYAQELRPHALYTLTTATGVYCMLRAFDENRLRYWAGAALCMAVSLYAYYLTVFYFLGMNVLFLIYFQQWKKHFWKWVFTQGAAGVLMIPAVLLAYVQLKYQQKATEFFFPFPTAKTAVITLKDFLAGYTPSPLVYWPLLVLGLGMVVLGVWHLRKRPSVALALLALAFVPIVSSILFWYTRGFPYYTHRAQLPSSIPFAILIAAGLVALRRPVWVASATVLLVALTVPALSDHYRQRLHPSWDHRLGARYAVDSRGAAAYIAAHMQPGDMVGHVTHFTQAPFQYHYLDVRQCTIGFTEEDSAGLFKGNADASMWKTTGWIPVRVENAIAGAKRVWLVTSWWEPFAPIPLVSEIRAWFDAHGVRLDRAQFDGISVYLYDMDPALRRDVIRNQVADLGDRAVNRFTLPAALRTAEATYSFDNALRNEMKLSFQDPPATLEADFKLQPFADRTPEGTDLIALTSDGKKPTIAGSTPTVLGDRYTANVRLRNNSDAARNMTGVIFEPAAIVDALSFDREPDSDVWRPGHQVSFSPPPPSFEGFSFAAHLDRRVTRGTLLRTLQVEPGTYTAYVHLAEECLPRNGYRAFLHGTVADTNGVARPLGTLSGHRTQGTSGWRWRRLGTFTAPGGTVTLGLTASNDDNLPDAYFDFDRVMLLPEAQADTPRPVLQFQVTLPPHEERSIPISGAMAGAASKNVEIEMEDLTTHESRRLFSEALAQ